MESKRLSDTADIILHTPNKALSLSTELANSAELPISIKSSGGQKNPILKSPSFSPIIDARGTSNFWELEENFDDDEEGDGAQEEDEGEAEEAAGEGKQNGNVAVDIVEHKEESETLRRVKKRVTDLAEELEKVKREKKANQIQESPREKLDSLDDTLDADSDEMLSATTVPSRKGSIDEKQEHQLLTEVVAVDFLLFLFSFALL